MKSQVRIINGIRSRIQSRNGQVTSRSRWRSSHLACSMKFENGGSGSSSSSSDEEDELSESEIGSDCFTELGLCFGVGAGFSGAFGLVREIAGETATRGVVGERPPKSDMATCH